MMRKTRMEKVMRQLKMLKMSPERRTSLTTSSFTMRSKKH